jgi:hypothetical protein
MMPGTLTIPAELVRPTAEAAYELLGRETGSILRRTESPDRRACDLAEPAISSRWKAVRALCGSGSDRPPSDERSSKMDLRNPQPVPPDSRQIRASSSADRAVSGG